MEKNPILPKEQLLCDLVPFEQFKKREKHLWKSATFSKVAGWCQIAGWSTNGAKSRNASLLFFFFFEYEFGLWKLKDLKIEFSDRQSSREIVMIKPCCDNVISYGSDPFTA